MKKTYLKVLALLTALLLIAGLGWFANGLLGNPVSKALATNTAKKYLAETYPDTDYYIERVSYNFKNTDYHALIKSPTSVDTEFSLYITMLGKLSWDTFEEVQNGFTTARRLENEYRELTDTVLEHPAFPYTCPIGFGTLEIYPEEALGEHRDGEAPPYAINQNELVLDKVYDIRELGRQAGHLVIYIESETVTPENAAAIMLDIKARFDKADIPFVSMDFTLQYPKTEEGGRPEEQVGVAGFLYDEIYEEGMVERVTRADEALKAYYAEQDAKKWE